jgi:hypothetical protein
MYSQQFTFTFNDDIYFVQNSKFILMWDIPLCVYVKKNLQVSKHSHPNTTLYSNFKTFNFNQPIPVAARSKVYVCGPRLLEMLVRMPPEEGMSICLSVVSIVPCEIVVFATRRDGQITRPEKSYQVREGVSVSV